MRRSVGVARANAKSSSAFQGKAEQMEAASLDHVRSSVETFRGHLEAFAVKHRDQIANDPEFRAAFASMCWFSVYYLSPANIAGLLKDLCFRIHRCFYWD